ncbi:hypothetical protein EV193_104558 [Herbihabitans rhizosphaerae]|uniref:WXG100 family type VII secretion target n=1 Tax=Herbihabitans rhizosphaerae TaxID=1872711 RepID=A0A4Q7KU19_9PSEU|nr:hypothetical protein [Herbihabitans rhizosphaerae]RZS39341.1 hypothetical protein EV193_104558 [Herbihabitans rhizosphaerae]
MSGLQPDARGMFAPKQDAEFPALKFNPAPGNLAKVRDLADTFSAVAREMAEARDALKGIGGDSGIWRGQAAREFGKTIGELPDYLTKANASLGYAGRELDRWAKDLADMQGKARHYEAQAASALDYANRTAANPNLKIAGQFFTDPAALKQAQQMYLDAAATMKHAFGNVDAIREQARQLQKDHVELGQQIAIALKKAREQAPEAPSLLSRALSGLGSWFKSAANVFKTIGTVLGHLSSVCGIFAVVFAGVPPVGAILGAAAGLTAIAATATKGIAKAGGADVSWLDIGEEALGALPFAKALKTGAEVSEKGLKGTTTAWRGVERARGVGGTVVERTKKTTVERLAGREATPKVYLTGEGPGRRLLAAGEGEIINGQLVGTEGINTLSKMFGKNGVIDPMSGWGRGIDIAAGTAKFGGGLALDD